MFNGISVYHDNGRTYSVDFDSNSGGSGNVSSSADTELFGLGGLTSGDQQNLVLRLCLHNLLVTCLQIRLSDESSNTFTTQSFSTLQYHRLEQVMV